MVVKNLLTIVGARPQFVKAAVVSRELKQFTRNSENEVSEAVLHTGQHYDAEMSQVFFDEMNIPPPFTNLNIGSGHHGETTGKMLAGIEKVIMERKPDGVLLYGDTNSTLAGAIAASKLHIPIAHIEAGLRSFNREMPEEINRIVTDQLSSLLLCPSESARTLLAQEGIVDGVHVVGDVMVDAVHSYRQSAVAPELEVPYALATLHRPANVDNPDRLSSILKAFESCPVPIVIPLHPRTAKALQVHELDLPANVTRRSPVSYFEMLGLLEKCAFVLTDSGGLQKEAYALEKPCITLRNQTEWTELVDAGVNRVVGADTPLILDAISWAETSISFPTSLYGDGKSAKRMVELIHDWL